MHESHMVSHIKYTCVTSCENTSSSVLFFIFQPVPRHQIQNLLHLTNFRQILLIGLLMKLYNT